MLPILDTFPVAPQLVIEFGSMSSKLSKAVFVLPYKTTDFKKKS